MNQAQEKQAIRGKLAQRFAGLWPVDQPGPLRTPEFPQAGKAAERLRRQAAYRAARVIAIQPDPVLLQARINALMDGKTLIAATPGLKQGLVRLSPDMVPVAARSRELTGHAMIKSGRQLRFPAANLGRVDMVVGACLGFDAEGHLLGDGRGLLDLFYALLRHLGMKAATPLAVIAADEQKMDAIPRQAWDAAANLVITPELALRFEQEQPAPKLAALPRGLASLPVVRSVMVRRDQSGG
jgi:5-formyltetrahydrofolate cyclo-ligase